MGDEHYLKPVYQEVALRVRLAWSLRCLRRYCEKLLIKDKAYNDRKFAKLVLKTEESLQFLHSSLEEHLNSMKGKADSLSEQLVNDITASENGRVRISTEDSDNPMNSSSESQLRFTWPEFPKALSNSFESYRVLPHLSLILVDLANTDL